MATNTVNLDALIARDDFAAIEGQVGGNPRTNISITDLDGGFFATDLRKPDFQRETTHWSPQKVVDLVRAFVKGDLIPAVILWQRGREIFVIDGAHRLSALIAWIKDDYGDRATSIGFFGPQISPEQIKIAERTRKLVNKEIGSYATFKGLRERPEVATEEHREIISALGRNSIIIQWVPARDAKTAETSFFKINQAAQPIDPTERRILESRTSANAIAARCLVRGGAGHKYWSHFSQEMQTEIESLGGEIYDALFKPPIEEPITTLDLPVAGRGYNQLPFAFDLVNLCNGVPIPEKSTTSKIGRPLNEDVDGVETVKFLRTVRKRVQLITTKEPGSLGLHPAVYFYAMSGNFLPNAFLATAKFVKELDDRNQKKKFTVVRKKFEDYLFKNKAFISLTVTKLGSGSRSLGRLSDLFWKMYEFFDAGYSEFLVSEELFKDPNFAHLAQIEVAASQGAKGRTGRMSGSTKSAVFMRDGYESATRCSICGGAVHFRSVSIDHIQRREDGGSGRRENGQISHPYCNTGFKS